VVAKYILAHGDVSECRIQEITIAIPELDFRISTRTEFHCQPRAVRDLDSTSRLLTCVAVNSTGIMSEESLQFMYDE
jgi:hypothetical protein